MAITFTSMSDYILKFYYMKRSAERFREDNKARFKTTSPWAITTELPTLRIANNVLTNGRGYTGKGGQGRWRLDSKVQFDKVYLCPETSREFTDDDLKRYYDNLYLEQEAFARESVDGAMFTRDPSTLNMVVRFKDGTVETLPLELIEELVRGTR